MQKLAVLILVASLAVAASVAQAGPTPAQKCTAAKLKATGKKASAKLKCHERAVLKGLAVDAACLTKAEEKFAEAFTKAEAKSGCVTPGDAGSIETLVDTFVDDTVDALEPPPVVVSFAADVQPIFSSRCTSCHSGAFPSGGLSLAVGLAYGNIVSVASGQVPALTRVLPSDASSSYLYRKITNAMGIVGAPMPFGSYPMPSGEIDTIEDWINQGALNN
jgi:hypothetical protein